MASDAVIPDPADPSRAIVGSYSGAGWGAYVGIGLICNIHDRSRCAGRPCVIHSPTEHHMRRWDLHWRDDRGLFERICPEHATGHPDPDQFAYWRETGQEGMGVHGCCGCCRGPSSAPRR